MRKPALLSTALLTALVCATPPALAQRSVDEAVRVIDSFRGTQQPGSSQTATPASFVPPPRTIADITAILDKQKPDPAKRAANLAAADKEPPAGMSPADLANFHFLRGLAATELGRSRQWVDDMKKAVEIGKQAAIPPNILSNYMTSLSSAFMKNGDIKSSLAIHEERIQLAGRIQGQSVLFPIYDIKIMTHLQLGQLDAARDSLARMEKLNTESASWRLPTPLFRDLFNTQVLRARASLASEVGNYPAAEAGQREALATAGSKLMPNLNVFPPNVASVIPSYRDAILDNLALTLLRQNRLVEAEAESRRALLNRLERVGRSSPDVGNSVLQLARILHEQGRYAETEKLADTAGDIYESLGHARNSYSVGNARSLKARAQAAQGRGAEARETYAALDRDLGNDADLRRQFLDMSISYAIAMLQGGAVESSVKIIERVVAETSRNLGDKAYAAAQTRGWLGVALAQQGQNDRALQELDASLQVLLTASRDAEDSDDDGASLAQRDRQTQLIVEAYLGLLADTKGSAAAVEAFRLADAIRGQSVQRALAASSARAAASDPKLANLVRYEQDAKKQAAALQGLLTNTLTRPTSEQDPKQVQKLREDIDKLRTARARLREEIEKRFPDYVNLIDPRPATIEQAQKSLRPGEALIATYAGTDRLFVWAIPHQGAPAYASSKVTDKEIEKLVTDLRKALDPNAETLEQVPAFDVATAYKLYELLLKPIEAGWKDAKSLMIVPHKALGQLPTALLVTENVPQPAKGNVFFAEYRNVPFLARKVAVTQLPSVSSLATLRALPAPKGERQMFAAFGDPWFSPEQATEAKAQQVAQLQTRGKLVRRSAPKTDVDSAELALLPRLPDTADEVKSIALALRADVAKDVFIGAAANEKTVKTMDLADRKVVMFATHGLVPGDLNGLTQPALALSAPKVADVDGDGLLTMEEVLALKLNADWVVLSACNTATGSGAGAEAVSGLGRAFFYAGTRALLVSNWPVETTSARILTTDLFRRQAEDAKLARGEAMRQAMVALIDSPGAIDEATKQPMFSYAHPIFWAPFSVVGDGG